MNDSLQKRRFQNFNLLGLALIAVALVIGAFVIAGAYKYKFKNTQTIRVTGSAGVDFTSDLIVWNGSYSRNDYDLKAAYAQLKSDENNIKSYLTRKGIKQSEIYFFRSKN
ncbi:SIMPL domain-containing protein [Niabella ginsengisoli]|uniref:SIMPL domain-containing protein n=1 Tax=Niabella ginsengisoli TaxID=522298 RepID=UPI0021D4456C|nr:SIMPL domain-containing protein [Niabella ginsengisoli]